MQEHSDKFDFQIILESVEVEKFSNWQKQCQMLYDSVRKNLSEQAVSKPFRFLQLGSTSF